MCTVPDIEEILEQRLEPDQRAAARDESPIVRTLACAGSGKSRTLAFRIARLVAQGEPASGIVAFTFTEKAADTIKRRAAMALEAVGLEPALLGAIYIGTIHSYCNNVLTAMDARYRQFDVLDGNRLKLYLISRYAQLGLRELRQSRGATYFDVIREVSNAWTTMNDEMIAIASVTAEDALLGAVLGRLSGRMDADNFIDFSLMVRRVAEALQTVEPGALRATESLRHLMVDEYQDVNPSQEVLIRQLRQRAASLFVVGDDDQSIYAWRGADVSNILEFSNRYPGCSSHTLSHNFRSTPAVVSAADSFIAMELGPQRITKNPYADVPAGPRDFRRLWFATRNEEADWVARMIESLLGTTYVERDGPIRGLTPGDFAILMRSTRMPEQDGAPRHGPFTRALDARNIDYTLEAGGGVFDRPQVAALRDTFELLRTRPPTRDEALAHFVGSVQQAYPSADFGQLAAVLGNWGRLIHAPIKGPRRRVYPQQLVHDLLESFRVADSHFQDGVMRDIGVFSRIIQDVEAVYLSIDSTQRFQEILNFLKNVAQTGYDTSTEELLRRPDTVTVSTVHKAKGLEFPVVFVVDVEAQRFPKNRHGYQGWLPTAVMQAALNRGAYQTRPEEEARLFYTAITRAERYLYVTGCANLPGGRRPRQRSHFWLRLLDPEISENPEEAPAGLTQHVQVRRIAEDVMPTSYSEIQYYLLCPRDYKFRKIFGFSPPIPELFGFGRAVHTAVGKLHEVFPERPPTVEEAETVARDVFHLKHVPPSGDPVNRPGAYERAQDSAAQIARTYAGNFCEDFTHERQVEARFEVPVQGAVISGSIDLLLRTDEGGNILEARVIDFKAIKGGENPEGGDELQWTDLALQVQLYAKAAREVLGENARTGAVHLLKDNHRIEVPVGDEAVHSAVANVEWAVERILAEDFPMRPHPLKCAECDFRQLCPKIPQHFSSGGTPPPIHTPTEPQMARVFSEFQA